MQVRSSTPGVATADLLPVTVTGGAEIRIAARMKDVGSDGEAEAASDQRIGSPVIMGQETSGRDGSRGAIGKELDPRFWIFVGDNGRHGPGKHGMSGGEGSIDRVMLQEIPVAIAFPGPLAAGDQLHGGIDEEGVGESFEFKFSGFFGVRVVGLNAVRPEPDQRGGETADEGVRGILISVEVSGGEIAVDGAISGEQGAGADEQGSVPLKVRRFEGSEVKIFLIVQDSPDRAADYAGLRA